MTVDLCFGDIEDGSVFDVDRAGGPEADERIVIRLQHHLTHDRRVLDRQRWPVKGADLGAVPQFDIQLWSNGFDDGPNGTRRTGLCCHAMSPNLDIDSL